MRTGTRKGGRKSRRTKKSVVPPAPAQPDVELPEPGPFGVEGADPGRRPDARTSVEDPLQDWPEGEEDRWLQERGAGERGEEDR